MKLLSAVLVATFFVTTFVGALQQQQKVRVLVGPNVFVSREVDGSVNELQVMADPTNAQRLLGSGILFHTNQSDGNQETRGYYSRDDGNSWTRIIYPEAAANFSGDPQVAYGRTGTGYFLYGGGPPEEQRIYFYRSEDGGVTWDKPVRFHFIDHEQIVVDQTASRFAGNVYVSGLDEYDGHTPGKQDAHISVFRSTDDGRSWIGPVDVANNHDMPGRRVQAENIAVFSDGQLFVPFVDFPSDMSTLVDGGQYHYWFATSSDGGATFSRPRRLVLKGGGEIVGPFNENPFFAIDNSNGLFRDRVYIVWTDICYSPGAPGIYAPPVKPTHPARLWISYSSDRGQTWSRPKIISNETPEVGDQANPPTIAVNNEGIVGVSWYDTRDTPHGHAGDVVNRYFAASVDGGETFTAAVRLSSAPTDLGETNRQVVAGTDGTQLWLGTGSDDHGEYLGLATATDGAFHPFWTDGRTGSDQIWTATVRVERVDSKTKVNADKTPELMEADVSDRVEPVLDPLNQFSPMGSVELPIRLRNKSDRPIYGPLKVEVAELTPEGTLLNAANGKSGVGATLDYSHSLGDLESLAPGAVSEAVTWHLKAPSKSSEVPKLRFKVTARIERPN